MCLVLLIAVLVGQTLNDTIGGVNTVIKCCHERQANMILARVRLSSHFSGQIASGHDTHIIIREPLVERVGREKK